MAGEPSARSGLLFRTAQLVSVGKCRLTLTRWLPIKGGVAFRPATGRLGKRYGKPISITFQTARVRFRCGLRNPLVYRRQGLLRSLGPDPDARRVRQPAGRVV